MLTPQFHDTVDFGNGIFLYPFCHLFCSALELSPTPHAMTQLFAQGFQRCTKLNSSLKLWAGGHASAVYLLLGLVLPRPSFELKWQSKKQGWIVFCCSIYWAKSAHRRVWQILNLLSRSRGEPVQSTALLREEVQNLPPSTEVSWYLLLPPFCLHYF